VTRLSADLQRQVKKGIVCVALVTASGASHLTAEVPAKDAMDKGRLVQSRYRQPISPATLVRIDPSLAQFPIVHGVQQVDEKFVSVFLSTGSKLVAVSVAAVSKRWDCIDDISRRYWVRVVEIDVVVATSCRAMYVTKERAEH